MISNFWGLVMRKYQRSFRNIIFLKIFIFEYILIKNMFVSNFIINGLQEMRSMEKSIQFILENN